MSGPRATSPLYLHVNRKAPVHVHLQASNKTARPHSKRMKASEWAKASKSACKVPWIPAPGKSSRPQMAWEGPTHRLEINPPDTDHEGTVLRMSDLSRTGNTTDIVLQEEEQDGGSEEYDAKLDSLVSEVGALKAEVDLQKSIRKVREREKELKNSKDSLKEKESELEYQMELVQERQRLQDLKEDLHNTRCCVHHERGLREKLVKRLVQLELDSAEAAKQAEGLGLSLRRLQRSKPCSIREVIEQKEALLERLTEFELSNKCLRRLLRHLQSHESDLAHVAVQREVLVQRLTELETDNSFLKAKLERSNRLAEHSQALHDEIGHKDSEIEGMAIKIQSLEEQLAERDLVCCQLEEELSSSRRKASREKDSLLKSNKGHRDVAAQSKQLAETLEEQVEHMEEELQEARSKVSLYLKEKIKNESQIVTLNLKMKELQEALKESKRVSQMSFDSLSSRLTEKTQELNCMQVESDELKTKLASLQGMLRSSEDVLHAKVAALESKILQLKTTVTKQDGLVEEYSSQLEKCQKECEVLSRELRRKDSELEALQQESKFELNKSRIKLKQQATELEPMSEMLKTTEARLRDALERLASHEKRAGEQNKIVAQLTAQAQQHGEEMEKARERWHQAVVESKSISARLEVAEKRLEEADSQNRELISMAGRKEEAIQRLQGRVEELLQEVSSLSLQLDSSKTEARRNVELLKDRSSIKEEANLTRITELESQLTRANGLVAHLRKSSDEAERKFQTRLHDLQDKLEQASASKRSLESYVNFLKTSYASVFNESGSPASPFSSFLSHP